jgi:acetyltransferase-like isoleucine patch superfamily enzyme
MGYLLLRNKPLEIEVGTPIDLHVPEWNIIIEDTVFGERVALWANVNVYGAFIGDECKLGSFVEIRKGVRLGRRCKLEPFAFIPEGVTLGEGVFIGPNVTFTNDLYPRACDVDGNLITDYRITPTFIDDHASIGAGCVIRCGLKVGKRAMIGAGSVLTKNVGDGEVWHAVAAGKKGMLKE